MMKSPEAKFALRVVLCSAVGSYCLSVAIMLGMGLDVAIVLLTTSSTFGAAAWFIAPFVVRWGEPLSKERPKEKIR